MCVCISTCHVQEQRVTARENVDAPELQRLDYMIMCNDWPI
jgi:hypothetical protein